MYIITTVKLFRDMINYLQLVASKRLHVALIKEFLKRSVLLKTFQCFLRVGLFSYLKGLSFVLLDILSRKSSQSLSR